jgi:hypothetical protein
MRVFVQTQSALEGEEEMSIELYSFERADGSEDGTYTTFNATEAREYARRYGLRMIANIYEFSDSELVEDHTRADQEEVTDA